jgi:hypothetical protein
MHWKDRVRILVGATKPLALGAQASRRWFKAAVPRDALTVPSINCTGFACRDDSTCKACAALQAPLAALDKFRAGLSYAGNSIYTLFRDI